MGLILALAHLCLIPAKWLGAINESINFRTTARLGFWCLAGLVGALIPLRLLLEFTRNIKTPIGGTTLTRFTLCKPSDLVCLPCARWLGTWRYRFAHNAFRSLEVLALTAWLFVRWKADFEVSHYRDMGHNGCMADCSVPMFFLQRNR